MGWSADLQATCNVRYVPRSNSGMAISFFRHANYNEDEGV